MRYRRFGRTEVMISVLSCGGMRFQSSWNENDPSGNTERLQRLLLHARRLGINHIETARSYGTSERELGVALRAVGKEDFFLQTKVAPQADARRFEAELERSFEALGVKKLDFFAFHGVNTFSDLHNTVKPGGCWEVAARFRDRGRIGGIGVSTHAESDVILAALSHDKFDYLNIHWYFIFQQHSRVLAEAQNKDLGVFIISPTDKGGHLHTPRELWLDLCNPLSPIQFNDVFCLDSNSVHTISVGASSPSDFDQHVEAVTFLELDKTRRAVTSTVDALERRWSAVLPEAQVATFMAGLPHWSCVPGNVNVRFIVWLWALAKAWDLTPFARSRYRELNGRDHWVPGAQMSYTLSDKMRRYFASQGLPADRLLGILTEAHALFSGG